MTLREAALKLGFLTAEQFDSWSAPGGHDPSAGKNTREHLALFVRRRRIAGVATGRKGQKKRFEIGAKRGRIALRLRDRLRT